MIKLAVLALLLPSMISCGAQTTVMAGLDCSRFVPERMTRPVASAPPPADDSSGEVLAFATTQTSRLAQANDNTATVVAIHAACEDEEKALAERLRPRTALERVTPWRE